MGLPPTIGSWEPNREAEHPSRTAIANLENFLISYPFEYVVATRALIQAFGQKRIKKGKLFSELQAAVALTGQLLRSVVDGL